MKNVCLLLILVALTGLILSCGNSGESKTVEKPARNYDKIENAGWLTGLWENHYPEGKASEQWKKLNDSTLVGSSHFIAGGDTVSSESIRLEQHAEDLFYIPIVQGQNAGQPVSFKLTSSSAGQLVFENPAHDFPQKITYVRISGDSLVAEISGTVEGQMRRQQFPLGRVH